MKKYTLTLSFLLIFLLSACQGQFVDITFVFNEGETIKNVRSDFEMKLASNIESIRFSNSSILEYNGEKVRVNRNDETHEITIYAMIDGNEYVYKDKIIVPNAASDLNDLWIAEIKMVRGGFEVHFFDYYYFESNIYYVLTNSNALTVEELLLLEGEQLISLHQKAVSLNRAIPFERIKEEITISFIIDERPLEMIHHDLINPLSFKFYEEDPSNFIEITLTKSLINLQGENLK